MLKKLHWQKCLIFSVHPSVSSIQESSKRESKYRGGFLKQAFGGDSPQKF